MTIYQDIVKTYRGWRKFDKRRFADSFVITKGYFKFNNHQEILDKFVELNSELKIRSAQDEFIKAKLVASIYFLRHKLGEKIDYFEYVKNTIGVTPKMMP